MESYYNFYYNNEEKIKKYLRYAGVGGMSFLGGFVMFYLFNFKRAKKLPEKEEVEKLIKDLKVEDLRKMLRKLINAIFLKMSHTFDKNCIIKINPFEDLSSADLENSLSSFVGNIKTKNFVKNSNSLSNSNYAMNKLKEGNSPLKKISIGDKMNSVNKSIFSEKANFDNNNNKDNENEVNDTMKYTMFNDVEGSKFNNKIKNENDFKEKIKISGKTPMRIKNEIIMENAEDDNGDNLYNIKNDERKSRKLDK